MILILGSKPHRDHRPLEAGGCKPRACPIWTCPFPTCPFLLGQKSCRTKVPRIFRIFVPNFAPDFAPNFPRIFRGFFMLRFMGNGDQKKFTKNPRHFSMQNSQENTKKIFTKIFWRAGKVSSCPFWDFPNLFFGISPIFRGLSPSSS